MTSKEMRSSNLFLRNEYECCGKWNIPVVKKKDININDLELISIADTKTNDRISNLKKGVHFFVDDYRFNGIYYNPQKSLKKLAQYRLLLTPDFSLYAEMPLWRQIESVAMNRWCGAYWQKNGLDVIPTVSWGLAQTYEFCFSGVEKGGIVAVGTVGCRKSKMAFLKGYNEMMRIIEPSTII